MREERLLERIRSLERDPLRREAGDATRLLNSILAHLRCILNTRQGTVPISPDYGLPDMVDFLQCYPESVRDIELSIQRSIELYEPRLVGVLVKFIPAEDDDLILRFQIKGKVHDGSATPVRFETTVEPNGKISVSR